METNRTQLPKNDDGTTCDAHCLADHLYDISESLHHKEDREVCLNAAMILRNLPLQSKDVSGRVRTPDFTSPRAEVGASAGLKAYDDAIARGADARSAAAFMLEAIRRAERPKDDLPLSVETAKKVADWLAQKLDVDEGTVRLSDVVAALDKVGDDSLWFSGAKWQAQLNEIEELRRQCEEWRSSRSATVQAKDDAPRQVRELIAYAKKYAHKDNCFKQTGDGGRPCVRCYAEAAEAALNG